MIARVICPQQLRVCKLVHLKGVSANYFMEGMISAYGVEVITKAKPKYLLESAPEGRLPLENAFLNEGN